MENQDVIKNVDNQVRELFKNKYILLDCYSIAKIRNTFINNYNTKYLYQCTIY